MGLTEAECKEKGGNPHSENIARQKAHHKLIEEMRKRRHLKGDYF